MTRADPADWNDVRFRTLFDQAPFSIQLLARDGRTLLVNPAWRRLWGFSDEVVDGYILREYNMLKDPVLEARGLAPYIRRAFEGESTRIPEALYDPNELGVGMARARWVGAVAYPLKDAAGQVREVVLIHNDVTDQRVANDERDRLLEQLTYERNAARFLATATALLQSSLDYDQIIDRIASAPIPDYADGCMIDLIDGTKLHRILTRHRDPATESLMRELQERFPPSLDSPAPTARVIRTGESELLSVVDAEQIRKHTVDAGHADLIGRIGIRSHFATPLKIRDQVIGVLNFLVTTPGRRSFDEGDVALFIKLAQRAAIAIDNGRLFREAQLASRQKDEFISVASHELKTPITSLKLQAQIASKRIEKTGAVPPEEVEKLVSNLNRQLDRLTRLVEDMLDISRISSGRLRMETQQADLGDLVRDVAGRFAAQLRDHGIRLDLELPAAVTIDCDPFRIEQVITNLLTNAIRYGEGRPIRIAISRTAAGTASIEVHDQGRGIAPEDRERIFNRFERAVSSTDISGLGLGLYISREIVQLHGGRIRVESELGKGSTFTVELPARA